MNDRWEGAMLANKVDKIDKRLIALEEQFSEAIMRLNAMPEKTVQIAIGSADGFLPDHLEKTKRAIIMLGFASACEVAKVTKRARAVESSYLCQLERMGIINVERAGRIKRFRPLTKPLLNAYKSFEQNPSNQSTINSISAKYEKGQKEKVVPAREQVIGLDR
jgi:ArsR family transcriptional regulator, lead/cadmium/zinc/bismuth-responsive transcriptional repressor